MNELIKDLKRRKVFRVAALYAVLSWLMIQVADTLVPMLNLPEFSARLVLFLLVVFFPIALFLAWAYEFTPAGIRTDDGSNRPTSKHSNAVTVSVVVIALLFGIGLFVRNNPAEMAPTNESAQSGLSQQDLTLDKSIAVLPFTAFSSNPDEQFFADGLADTLLHKLAQLSDIRVISRTSSFQYRGEAVDVRQVGEELNVATVLEGSVQRSGDQLRIIAQLVNTQDGGHIWSETFDRSSNDFFAIHDEIADAVVISLQVSMTPEEQERIQNQGTTSVEAFNRLTYLSERMQATESFELSEDEYSILVHSWADEIDGILTIDPDFAEAYRRKARGFDALLFRSPQNSPRRAYYLREAFGALHQAMLLEPENPSNFALYASLHRRTGDPVTAEVFSRMALDRLPNSTEVLAQLALSLSQQEKNPEEALELSRREAVLNPSASTNYRRQNFALIQLGRFEEALNNAKAAIDSDSSLQLIATDIGGIQAGSLGRHRENVEDQIAIRQQLENQIGDVYISGWLTQMTTLGVFEEIDKLAPQTPDRLLIENFSLVRQVRTGNIKEANQTLASLSNVIGDIQSSRLAADICMELGDYECAIDRMLFGNSNLDTRFGQNAELIQLRNVEDGIHLAFYHQKAGQIEEANRLLGNITEWLDTRRATGYVFSREYYSAKLSLLLGDEASALQQIRVKIEMENDNFIALCQHCSFDSPIYEALHDNQEFQRLAVEYERRRSIAADFARTRIAEAGY